MTIAAMATPVPTLISLDEAQRIVRAHIASCLPVDRNLASALGYTLARPVICDIDMPPFDRAMMDGFAVRAADVGALPARLEVIGRVPAGSPAATGLGAGQAMQINTGAPIPSGADAVVKFEDTAWSADQRAVTLHHAPKPGEHVGSRGEFVRAGAEVLPAGIRLGSAEVVVAATAGAAQVTVFELPRVAVLVTGDELVDAARQPAVGQIRDSNGPMLRALFAEEGIPTVDLGRACDDRDRLAACIERGLAQDVLCITGGISMGAFDFVPEVLERCGVRIHFRKMATKPGKPTLFGTLPSGALVFGLPGNPVSALIGYWTLVRPAVTAKQGRDTWPQLSRAVLHGSTRATGDRQSFWPARIEIDEEARLCATALTWYGSGDPFGVRGAHGYIVRPPHAPAAGAGDLVEVLITRGPLSG